MLNIQHINHHSCFLFLNIFYSTKQMMLLMMTGLGVVIWVMLKRMRCKVEEPLMLLLRFMARVKVNGRKIIKRSIITREKRLPEFSIIYNSVCYMFFKVRLAYLENFTYFEINNIISDICTALLNSIPQCQGTKSSI